LTLSDSDTSSQAFGELGLREELTSFLEDVLAVNSGVDTFDYVELELDVIVSSFNRRRRDAGLSMFSTTNTSVKEFHYSSYLVSARNDVAFAQLSIEKGDLAFSLENLIP
jgi:hypothetical protein